MATEEGRTLTEPETQEPLRKHAVCHICLESLAGYHRPETELDHIYGYPQDLSNSGPVHASASDHKRTCHAAKARKPPVEYREQVRIKNALQDVTGLPSLCPFALPSVCKILTDRRTMAVSARLQHSC